MIASSLMEEAMAEIQDAYQAHAREAEAAGPAEDGDGQPPGDKAGGALPAQRPHVVPAETPGQAGVRFYLAVGGPSVAEARVYHFCNFFYASVIVIVMAYFLCGYGSSPGGNLGSNTFAVSNNTPTTVVVSKKQTYDRAFKRAEDAIEKCAKLIIDNQRSRDDQTVECHIVFQKTSPPSGGWRWPKHLIRSVGEISVKTVRWVSFGLFSGNDGGRSSGSSGDSGGGSSITIGRGGGKSGSAGRRTIGRP